jgi:hypothetical protein
VPFELGSLAFSFNHLQPFLTSFFRGLLGMGEGGRETFPGVVRELVSMSLHWNVTQNRAFSHPFYRSYFSIPISRIFWWLQFLKEQKCFELGPDIWGTSFSRQFWTYVVMSKVWISGVDSKSYFVKSRCGISNLVNPVFLSNYARFFLDSIGSICWKVSFVNFKVWDCFPRM